MYIYIHFNFTKIKRETLVTDFQLSIRIDPKRVFSLMGFLASTSEVLNMVLHSMRGHNRKASNWQSTHLNLRIYHKNQRKVLFDDKC